MSILTATPLVSNQAHSPAVGALVARQFDQEGASLRPAGVSKGDIAATGRPELREVFDDFVGQTFYSQMLSAMRKTVDKPAYFHGGHAEEMFQNQLDQTLAERLADTTANQFSGPMFELFNLSRR